TVNGNSTSSGDAGGLLNVALQPGAAARATVVYPSWVRIQRVGNVIYYYYCNNSYGTNWTFWTMYDSTTSAAGPLPATMQLGLALTSHDTGRTADMTMASFSTVDDGALRFTVQPTNAIVNEGGAARFYGTVAGRSPWFFQWSTNGVGMAFGPTNTSVTISNVPFAYNNMPVTLTVTNPYGEKVTASANIIVTAPDNTKPTVAKVGSLFKNVVEVYFSEGVTAASANNAANYTLRAANGTQVAISYVVQDFNNPAHVTVNTANMPDYDLMQLACQGLVDLSLQANVMTLQTNVFRANNFDYLENINNTQAFSARAEGDQIFMTGGGADIWGTADQCAYLYKSVSGNFDIKVQGLSLPAVNAWSKMGLMARNSYAQAIGSGDRNLFACFTPTAGQNQYSPQVRTNSGYASSSVGTGEDLLVNLQAGVAARPTVVYPSWLRLQRIGDKFYYYYSTTGTNWTFWTWYDSASSSDGALPQDLLLGLALTSHDTANTVDGVMASFSAVNDGPLRFLTEPVSTNIIEGASASFSASVIGRGPYTYQWLKNDVAIPNATGTSVALTNVPLSESGSRYACRVTNPYGDNLTSSNAILTVIQDTFKPVAYAVGSLRGTNIGVYFRDDNLLDPVTAGDPANYTVNNGAITVIGATVEPDRLAVILSLSAPVSGAFSVAIKNVKDAAPIP
ncbi:MAG TPA: hypothetical protein VNT26_22890, partial [Candidatus Sulfotelmatobacter sp.]|nr:hypothetical protein [Candidatus Sulfotelmatobacter sp.]